MPENWEDRKDKEKPRCRTRSELSRYRKREALPDLSYDLDNDGIVCQREYFIARRFDKNADGRLDPDERKNALNSLNEGLEDKFYWGVEKSGALRGRRLMQVRGKIVDAENFNEVCDTYPAHPISLHNSLVTTSTELKLKRKNQLMYIKIPLF